LSAMGWKTTLGVGFGVVWAAITFVTDLRPSYVIVLFDSLIPNAGYYMVYGVFAVFVIYLFAAATCVAYYSVFKRFFKRFSAEIVGKEPFLLGGTIGFKASYKGKLEKGFFTCRVVPPSGGNLPTEKETYEFWPCYGTFKHIENRDVGILEGSKNYEYEWNAEIPRTYREGVYTAFVGVYESQTSGNECVKEKRLLFHVVDPKNIVSGSPGVTATYTGETSDLRFV
jgi:hypothetical protein